MEAQIPASINTAFAGVFIVATTTKQEQIPGAQYVMEGTSPTTLTQDRSMWFMVS